VPLHLQHKIDLIRGKKPTLQNILKLNIDSNPRSIKNGLRSPTAITHDKLSTFMIKDAHMIKSINEGDNLQDLNELDEQYRPEKTYVLKVKHE